MNRPPWSNQNGQTLVEVALVLPVISLGVVVTVLLIVFCHNQIALQMMAFKEARRITAQTSAPLWRSNPLWGHATPALRRRSTTTQQPWRPFIGEGAVVKSPGHLSSISYKSQLWPGRGYRWIVPFVTQQALAETPIEPPLPPED